MMAAQLQSFFSALSVGSVFASVGALVKMYSLGIQQSEQIQRLREEINDERKRNDAQDARHTATEIMLSRIDANVAQLLQMQRSDNRGPRRQGE